MKLCNSNLPKTSLNLWTSPTYSNCMSLKNSLTIYCRNESKKLSYKFTIGETFYFPVWHRTCITMLTYIQYIMVVTIITASPCSSLYASSSQRQFRGGATCPWDYLCFPAHCSSVISVACPWQCRCRTPATWWALQRSLCFNRISCALCVDNPNISVSEILPSKQLHSTEMK